MENQTLFKMHAKIARMDQLGYTECSMIVGNSLLPSKETVYQLLDEGYDVIYTSLGNLAQEVVVISWENGRRTHGKVYQQRKLLGKRESSVDRMYKDLKEGI